jgi:SAM-dependent methyltransferase
MRDESLIAGVRDYYDARLRQYGPTARGVDWNSEESQYIRFRELARLWGGQPDASIVDYGCGYGALAVWLRTRGHSGPYLGFDVSEAMTTAARAQTAALAECRFTSDRASVAVADYAIASGIFNVKLAIDGARWREYVLAGIADLAALGRRGFAFNVLTAYSDPDKRRADLYYADPVDLFEHCRHAYSRFVSLIHDYPLYEFTILVRR